MTDHDSTSPPPQAQAVRRPMDDEISLWEVLAVLLRRRGTIVSTTLLIGGLAAGIAHFMPLTYTTSPTGRQSCA